MQDCECTCQTLVHVYVAKTVSVGAVNFTGSTLSQHTVTRFLLSLQEDSMSNMNLVALQAGSYIVMYTAVDKAGNVGTANRTVTVVSPCGSPEHFCSRSAFN